MIIGKEDFLSNYELVNDFIPSSINIVKSYVNIGLDLNEFLQNSLIIKDIVKDYYDVNDDEKFNRGQAEVNKMRNAIAHSVGSYEKKDN